MLQQATYKWLCTSDCLILVWIPERICVPGVHRPDNFFTWWLWMVNGVCSMSNFKQLTLEPAGASMVLLCLFSLYLIHWDRNSGWHKFEGSVMARLGVRDFEIHWISRGFGISEWIFGFQSGFWIQKSAWNFQADFWISFERLLFWRCS